MRAMILEKGRLVEKDIPKPVPKSEEALVRITAAGVCHSDVHLVKGDWPALIPPFPIPVGHEGIGIVEEIGPGGEKYVQVGDRVILGLGGTGGGYWCGACEYCLSGNPRHCSQAKGIIGAYAEYISVWVKSLVKLPDTVSDTEAPLACGGLTAYSAVKKLFKFGVLPGKPVAIVGAAGGLGHYAVQAAQVFGYKVVAIDVGTKKIEFLKNLGADYAVDVSEAVPFVKENFGGVYGSVVFAPQVSAFELGLKLVRKGGVFVSVGMPAASEGSISISPLQLLAQDILIMSSAVGSVEDMREVVQLAADGKLKTHVARVGKLSELSRILDDLAEGKFAGRAIITDMQN